MHGKSTFLCGGLILLAVTADTALAEQVTLAPSRDNTLYQETNGLLSNGAGQNLFAGAVGSNSGGAFRRALLAFDLSSIPSGSTVNSATLRMTVNKTTDGAARTITVHRVSRDWGEAGSNAASEEGAGTAAMQGDATWVHTFFSSQLWNTPGGDFNSSASASTSVGGNGNYSWSSAALAADVQAWVNDPSNNFGWLVRGAESQTQTTRRFASRENPTAASRPSLTVDYTPAAAPELNEALYFAQFGNGTGFFSQITLINTNTLQDAIVKILIKEDDGDPFVVDLNGETLTNGELDTTVPASGIRVYKTDASGQIRPGAVTVRSDIPLTGVIVFGGVFGLAGVADSDETSQGFTGPVETLDPSAFDNNINTGLAVQNLENELVTLSLELLNADGIVLATATINIPSMGHAAVFVPGLNWSTAVDFSDFIGTIRATTSGSVAATMIQQRVVNGTVQFATLPVKTM